MNASKLNEEQIAMALHVAEQTSFDANVVVKIVIKLLRNNYHCRDNNSVVKRISSLQHL
jgi:hypothetical protein